MCEIDPKLTNADGSINYDVAFALARQARKKFIMSTVRRMVSFIESRRVSRDTEFPLAVSLKR
jgi:hypothetical protein